MKSRNNVTSPLKSSSEEIVPGTRVRNATFLTMLGGDKSNSAKPSSIKASYQPQIPFNVTKQNVGGEVEVEAVYEHLNLGIEKTLSRMKLKNGGERIELPDLQNEENVNDKIGSKNLTVSSIPVSSPKRKQSIKKTKKIEKGNEIEEEKPVNKKTTKKKMSVAKINAPEKHIDTSRGDVESLKKMTGNKSNVKNVEDIDKEVKTAKPKRKGSVSTIKNKVADNAKGNGVEKETTKPVKAKNIKGKKDQDSKKKGKK